MKPIIRKVFLTGLIGMGIFILTSQMGFASAITDVAEIANFSRIYQIDIPDDSNYNGSTPV